MAIKKANIQWSAKQITKSIEKGTITFDNAIQRGFVWDNDRKSLLIHSMLEGYPIPAFFAAKDEKGYSMLDGKQRSNAIADYINGNYFLTNLPEVMTEITVQNTEKNERETIEEDLDVNGSYFSDLPEDLQDRIKDYSLTVYYFDGITEEEINEMFFRLNNGKPLTAIELTRVKAKSLEKFQEIAKHQLFTSTLTEKAISKYTHEDLVIKSWVMFFTENPDLSTKNIRSIVEKEDVTNEQVNNLNVVYDKVLEIYTILTAGDKQDKKTAKRIITRTHFLSLLPIISKQIDNNSWDTQQFTSWVRRFFGSAEGTTINEEYNELSKSGSNKSDNIRRRLEIVKIDFRQYLLSGQDIKDGQDQGVA